MHWPPSRTSLLYQCNLSTACFADMGSAHGTASFHSSSFCQGQVAVAVTWSQGLAACRIGTALIDFCLRASSLPYFLRLTWSAEPMAVCSFETNVLQGFKSRLSVIIHDHLRAQLGPKEQQVGGTVTAQTSTSQPQILVGTMLSVCSTDKGAHSAVVEHHAQGTKRSVTRH